jgi:hypothetical protein
MPLAGEPQRIVTAYAKGFAKDPHWRRASPPLPFAAFMAQTPRYLQ